MAYNNMHEVQFRDAVAAATDAAVAEARDYWQGLADAGGGPDAQRYAAICRDELKARDEATTALHLPPDRGRSVPPTPPGPVRP